MQEPQSYQRTFWQWFQCPSCGYSRQGAMSKAEIAPDHKHMKLLYLCERCNSVCTLKHPAFNGAVLLIIGGPFFFAPAFYALWQVFPTSSGFAYTLLPGLGAALITYLAVLVLGRFIHKYVPLRDGAA